MATPGHPDHQAPTPRLYADLAWVWPYLSPPEDYPEEVATFRARFARHGVADGAAVLHLGCGGGSIDWHLKRHYSVTGVDSSPEMLEHARAVNPEVEYAVGDIRDIRLGRTFDAVLLHDAVAYMTTPDDLRAAYATAAAHLRPGGVLVTLPEQLREHFHQHAVSGQTHTRGDRSVTTIEVDFDPDPTDTTCETTYIYVIREPGLPPQIETDMHVCGLYHLHEVMDALRSVGFDPVAEAWDLPPDMTDGEILTLITALKRGTA